MSGIDVPISRLREAGIETLPRGFSDTTVLPRHTVIEAPSSLKWTQYHHSIELGAFSYQVSGYCFAARIGRYCSIGEDVQIGRQDHPLNWVSTSPAFYLGDKLFDLDDRFEGGKYYHKYKFTFDGPPTRAQITTIGNDVWIGHGAYIRAGVKIGDGAIIAAHSVVTKDVEPYTMVAGNPAKLKKYRSPARVIAGMQAVKWWKYAPWQLQHLDPSKPLLFIKGVRELEVEPFKPDVFDLRSV